MQIGHTHREYANITGLGRHKSPDEGIAPAEVIPRSPRPLYRKTLWICAYTHVNKSLSHGGSRWCLVITTWRASPDMPIFGSRRLACSPRGSKIFLVIKRCATVFRTATTRTDTITSRCYELDARWQRVPKVHGRTDSNTQFAGRRSRQVETVEEFSFAWHWDSSPEVQLTYSCIVSCTWRKLRPVILSVTELGVFTNLQPVTTNKEGWEATSFILCRKAMALFGSGSYTRTLTNHCA